MKDEKDGAEFVLSLDNLPSRCSSLGCSSRLYYYRRTTEGVPFQWEMQPGTPKDQPYTEAVTLLITPPPAALSLRPPKPARTQGKQSLFLLFRPWRKQSKSKKHSCLSDEFEDGRSRFGSCGSQCEFIQSPCQPKSSSSSSWSSSPAAESSAHRRLGCGPWRINPLRIVIGRRV